MKPEMTEEYLRWAIVDQNMMIVEVARSLGVSTDRVKRHIVRYDIPYVSRFTKIEVDYDALEGAYKGGKPLVEIAKDFGMQQPTLSRHIRKLANDGRIVMRSSIKKVKPIKVKIKIVRPDPNELMNQTYNSAMQMGSELLLKRQMAAGIYWRSAA